MTITRDSSQKGDDNQPSFRSGLSQAKNKRVPRPMAAGARPSVIALVQRATTRCAVGQAMGDRLPLDRRPNLVIIEYRVANVFDPFQLIEHILRRINALIL